MDDQQQQQRFCVDYGKRGCKCQMTKCKKVIDKGVVRIAKVVPNPFSDEGGDMKQYHHPECLFDAFRRARATTRVIEDPSDLEGWEAVTPEDRQTIVALIDDLAKFRSSKAPPKKAKAAASTAVVAVSKVTDVGKDAPEPDDKGSGTTGQRCRQNEGHPDNSFREFRRLCAAVAALPGYLDKTEAVRRLLLRGSSGSGFQGDVRLWVRLLLPGVIKRVYNLQSRQLVKLFSRIFGAKDPSEMLTDLTEKGDAAETVATFYESYLSGGKGPKETSEKLNLYEVDDFLAGLAGMTKEEEQLAQLAEVTRRCGVNDLRMFVRLIKGDLRIGAGAKHILEALHPDAYEAFNTSRNVDAVVDRVMALRREGGQGGGDGRSPGTQQRLSMGASLLQPVQPMLAQPCRSVDMAFAKCPNQIYCEIKYDGERVQLHKKANQFSFFSRSLKPVMPHKVKPFKDHIPKAFPGATDLIIDAEVLMVDHATGDPLPFGTLGVHKAAGFSNASPCLFVFDIIHYDGENLMERPLRERRKLLLDQMREVENFVKLSDLQVIKDRKHLAERIHYVLQRGLEGLVLKDSMSKYEPGKRHWLKLKKDYLNEGAMADSADLVVLGAWFGTGNRGGIMSIFLMGCFDRRRKRWCTVTKVHGGHDDATLDRLQGELKPNLRKIKQDHGLLPDWLDCNRQMTPDFVVLDPCVSPVWEITGAEFSKAGELHTAEGISIRFPRVTKIRDDKTWENATSLDELRDLFEASKRPSQIDLSLGDHGSDDEPSPPKVAKGSPSKATKALKAAKASKVTKASPEKTASGTPASEKTDVEEKASPSKRPKIEGPEVETGSLEVSNGKATPAKNGERRNNKVNSQKMSFDKRYFKSDAGFEMVVKAEKFGDGALFKGEYDALALTIHLGSLDQGSLLADSCRVSSQVLGAAELSEVRKELRQRRNEKSDGGGFLLEAKVPRQGGHGKGHRLRSVHFLILAKSADQKPSYECLRKAVAEMGERLKGSKAAKVAVLVSGADPISKLSWNAARTLVKNVLHDLSDISVTFYNPQLPPVPAGVARDQLEPEGLHEGSTLAGPSTDCLDIFEGKPLKKITKH